MPGYAFPMQLWPQVWHAGLRLTEIPVRLIYNDPTRHFGGNLDDAGNRLRHYLEVLHEEIAKLSAGGHAPELPGVAARRRRAAVAAGRIPPRRAVSADSSPARMMPCGVLPCLCSE